MIVDRVGFDWVLSSRSFWFATNRVKMSRTLTIRDPESGTTVDVPVINGTISATCFSKFKINQTKPKPEVEGDKVPLRLFDAGFKCEKNII